MTEVIGMAAAALPTAASMKRAAEIVILDPVFGGSSSSSSNKAPETLLKLTNGLLRLAVAAVEAIKKVNDARLKVAGKPVVNKDKSVARLVAHVCGTDAPTDDATAEREGASTCTSRPSICGLVWRPLVYKRPSQEGVEDASTIRAPNRVAVCRGIG